MTHKYIPNDPAAQAAHITVLESEIERLRKELAHTRALVPTPDSLAHLHPAMNEVFNASISLLRGVRDFAIAWHEYGTLTTRIDTLILFAAAVDLEGKTKPSLLKGAREELIDAIRKLRSAVESLPDDPREREGFRLVSLDNSERVAAIDEFMTSTDPHRTTRLREAITALPRSRVSDLGALVLSKKRRVDPRTDALIRLKEYIQSFKFDADRSWRGAAIAIHAHLKAQANLDDPDRRIFRELAKAMAADDKTPMAGDVESASGKYLRNAHQYQLK